jgi:hypothetical protein
LSIFSAASFVNFQFNKHSKYTHKSSTTLKWSLSHKNMILKQVIIHLINPKKHIKVKQNFKSYIKKTPMIQKLLTKKVKENPSTIKLDSSTLQHHMRIKLLQLKNHPHTNTFTHSYQVTKPSKISSQKCPKCSLLSII